MKLPHWLGILAGQRLGAGQVLSVPAEPAAIYAIGDVHGCHDLLLELEQRIMDDARTIAGEKWIVMLGDYVDRGPRSDAVLDHLTRPLPAETIARLCIAGNHDRAMLEFIDAPVRNSSWLDFGGLETLGAYGVSEALLRQHRGAAELRQVLLSHIPDEHLGFLRELPLAIETPNHIFVHAGLRPGLPLERQSETDLIWSRHGFDVTYAEFGKLVVHGHTPVPSPVELGTRLALDTGACFGGQLTAARLVKGERTAYLTAGPARRGTGRGDGNHAPR